MSRIAVSGVKCNGHEQWRVVQNEWRECRLEILRARDIFFRNML